jgi:heme oxygenase (biliverdin-producing, ferredoxin)
LERPLTESLGERLKSATKGLHHEVERGPFMRALLRGSLDCAAYCALLRNLYDIYDALEVALETHAEHPGLKPLRLSGLERREALARDLEDLHGPNWAGELKVLEGCRRYVKHLHQLTQSAPERLAAHAYVRYLGDLSGGQLLQPIVAKSLQLPAGRGTAFYDFGAAAEVGTLKRRFRAGLDQVADAHAGDVSALVNEARTSFELHRSLFGELAQHCVSDDTSAAAALKSPG